MKLTIKEVILKKSGNSKGRNWNLYSVSTDQGQFSCFQDDIQAFEGQTINCIVEENDKGKTIKKIMFGANPVKEADDDFKTIVTKLDQILASQEAILEKLQDNKPF